MAAHLSPLDAMFLELEQADPNAHMHIGAVMVFDPLPVGGAPLLEELLAHVDERLDALPRYRQRLSSRTAGGLRRPAWVDDERFDVAAHVHRAALPSPGGDRELLDWASDFFSHRLDRDRPLWEIVLIEGLEGGRWALASKTHHAMVDGVGSVDIHGVLLDTSPEPGPWSPPPAAATPHDGGLRDVLTAPIRAALHPLATGDRVRHLADLLVQEELIGAPHTGLNVPIGKLRRLDAVDVPFDAVRSIKRTLGGTVNDVALALVTAGLRRLLLARGERLPSRPLRAMVPVNVRGDHGGTSGNFVSSLFVHLPVAIEDSARRYAAIRRDADALKHSGQAAAGVDLVRLAGLAPPVVLNALSRATTGARVFNVTITNIPGPRVPLYAFGAGLRRIVPLVPIAADHALAVAIVSYGGDLCFCANADRDVVPELSELSAGIVAELAALEALCSATSRS